MSVNVICLHSHMGENTCKWQIIVLALNAQRWTGTIQSLALLTPTMCTEMIHGYTKLNLKFMEIRLGLLEIHRTRSPKLVTLKCFLWQKLSHFIWITPFFFKDVLPMFSIAIFVTLLDSKPNALKWHISQHNCEKHGFYSKYATDNYFVK